MVELEPGQWIRFEVIVDQRPFTIVTNSEHTLAQWWAGMLSMFLAGSASPATHWQIQSFKFWLPDA